jgi:hypothetical protein
MNPLLALAGGSALLGAGASIFGSSQQARAQRQAAQMQAQAAAQARADMEPWRQAGLRALPTYEAQVNVPFQESDAYRFQMEQGMNAINNSARARGLYGSGSRAMALQRFGQGLAAQEYNNYLNRLAGLSGVGQQAAGAGAQFGMAGAQGAGQGMANAGGAMGGGYVGAANALTGGVNNLLSLYAFNPAMFGGAR